MAKLTINPQDMKRNTVLDQGWYPVEVTAVNEEPNSKGDAQNIIVDLVGLSSSDSDKNKAAGVPLRRYFTEKAPGFAVNFIRACGGVVGEEGGTFDIASSVGRKLEAFVKPRPYEGRMTNDVADFRKLEG
jgi:hypothetical protein